jgi:hypothetical protein
MVDDKEKRGSDDSYQQAIEVETSNSRGAKHVEEPTAHNSADNAEKDIHDYAFSRLVHNLATDESGNQT